MAAEVTASAWRKKSSAASRNHAPGCGPYPASTRWARPYGTPSSAQCQAASALFEVSLCQPHQLLTAIPAAMLPWHVDRKNKNIGIKSTS